MARQEIGRSGTGQPGWRGRVNHVSPTTFHSTKREYDVTRSRRQPVKARRWASCNRERAIAGLGGPTCSMVGSVPPLPVARRYTP